MKARIFWKPQSRQSRSYEALEPLPFPILTPEQIQGKRLELAAEMLELVLTDGQDLPGSQRRTLRRLSEGLADLRLQGR